MHVSTLSPSLFLGSVGRVSVFVRQFHESEYSTCSNELEFPLCLNSSSVKCLLAKRLLKDAILSLFDFISHLLGHT